MSTDISDLDALQAVIRAKEQVPLQVEPGTAALVVVDLQRYFTEPEHPLGRVMAHLLGGPAEYFNRVNERVVPNTRRLIDAFRELALPVYYTAFGTESGDGTDLPPYMQGFDALGMMLLGERTFPAAGHESWQIDERLAPRPGETVLHKTTASPFVGTDLERELRDRGIHWLMVTGVVTECCVGQTARDAADLGFHVIVVDDACTGTSDAAHRVLVDSFAAIFGHRRSTDAVIELVAEQPSLARERQEA